MASKALLAIPRSCAKLSQRVRRMVAVTMIAVTEGAWQRLDDRGQPVGDPVVASDLPSAAAELERGERPRWLWAGAEQVYPRLLERGVRLRRCHDLELVEALLLASEGDYGAPRSVAAAHARLMGLP